MMPEIKYFKLLSIAQASKILSIGRDTLKSLIAKGQIGYIPFGKRVKIPYEELAKYISINVVKQKEEFTYEYQGKRKLKNLIEYPKNDLSKCDGRKILNNIIRNKLWQP